MTNARARFALLCVLAFSVAGAAGATPATAFITYYDCTLKPSNVWCDGRANSSFDAVDDYDYAEGWYPGPWDGTVTACQRLYRVSDGAVLSGSSCAANFTSNDYPTQTTNWEANVKQISGGDHSIHGMADTNY